jgi:mRNA interferase RelE/StbE
LVYKVVYLNSVEQDLHKLDKSIARKILSRIENYLARDPKELGKPLKGDFQSYWRYRWGDYRVIYKISDKEILILVLRIGHRREIYEA